MTSVARRASCSKETLYKWFGDRDGLLTATVQWQAAKVKAPQVDRWRLDAASLRQSIEQFARDLLGTISGEVSVTLNRLAIGHAGAEKHGLGEIVLENGPLAIRKRLKPVLEAGREAACCASKVPRRPIAASSASSSATSRSACCSGRCTPPPKPR